jgi:hypothetical protein
LAARRIVVTKYDLVNISTDAILQLSHFVPYRHDDRQESDTQGLPAIYWLVIEFVLQLIMARQRCSVVSY